MPEAWGGARTAGSTCQDEQQALNLVTVRTSAPASSQGDVRNCSPESMQPLLHRPDPCCRDDLCF
eukprot:1158286-Pelagomonas_calceolata.AAC.6